MQGDKKCLKLFVVFAVILLQYLNPSLSLGIFNNSGEIVAGHKDVNADMTGMRCIEREREALLAFQRGFVVNEDSREVFSSWGRQVQKHDCCNWTGVYCDNQTGHVIQLDLGLQILQGKMISPKLIELQHLEYLDLSYIDFNGSQIPDFIGSLTKLRHLDLSGAFFGGQFPSQVGNLTHLQFLDLSDNQFTNIVQNLNWLPRLSSLKYLALSYTNLSNALDWHEGVNNLPNLQNLTLVDCGLPSPPIHSTTLSNINSSKSLAHLDLHQNHLTSSIFPWLSNYNTNLVYLDLFENELAGAIPDFFGTMSYVSHLDLSHNQLTGSIPNVFGNMSSLTYLDLSFNHLTGSIPDVFGNMSSLAHLELSFNQVEGRIPHSFARLCSLQLLSLSHNSLSGQVLLPSCAQNSLEILYLNDNHLSGSLPNLTNFLLLKELDLSNNQLRGRVQESIGQLSKLEFIYLSWNALDGVISETHFSQLSRLMYLDLSFTSLVFNFPSDWIPPFQVNFLSLASCKNLGPHFPKWLQTQKQYTYLDISDSGISDIAPSWFWELSPNLAFMNISHNKIRGTFANLTLNSTIFPVLHLSSNQLEGPVPLIFSQASFLDLSDNKMSGSISSLCDSVGRSSPLGFLSLSSNNISGELPDCLRHLDRLVMLDLSNNSLSGKLPTSLGSLFQIETLKLRGNKFVGELPSSLKNCTSLQVVDLGYNRLSGSIPEWLAVSLPNLVILMLQSNHFSGSIPSQLCHLTHIQILDFSGNIISGSIPKCLNNLTTLAQRGNSNLTISHYYHPTYNGQDGYRGDGYNDHASLVWKGSIQVYGNTLGLVKSIDLSSNRLTGEIPNEITHLVGLVSLNLSRNHLTGQITPDIGKLDSLDSLDLSRNLIDGIIPPSLARIDRLSLLDLSYNNLSGRIPTGTQLQGFNSSVYAGNFQLCGPPLTKSCDPKQTAVSYGHEDKDELISLGFYISMGLGFAVGFWGVCGSLIFNRRWRYAYLKFLNVLNDWLYLRLALLKREFNTMRNNMRNK